MHEELDSAHQPGTRLDIAKGVRVARSVGVVSGGPLALTVASALAPIAAVRRWPQRIDRPLPRRLAWAVTAAGLVFPAVYALVLRPWLRLWGSTAHERSAVYPGDDPAGPRPGITVTRAVTVDAPAERVWPWLAQIGQERAGFYTYDALENLAGLNIHSANRIHPEWQVKRGDPVGMAPDFGTEVEAVMPGHALVLKNWGAYIVEPVTESRSRLIARAHVDRGLPSLAYILTIELPHSIMERRMLLGIKERAEATAMAA